jgi:tetratricopeptide (TPR) repeat protein
VSPNLGGPLERALAEALTHFGAGRLAEAAAIGHDMLALRPLLAQALHLMGALALRDGRPGDAVGLVGQAIVLDEGVPTYHNSLGQAHRALGAPAAAIACYERALSINPNLGPAHGNLAQVLVAGDLATAVAYYRRLVEVLPANALARSNFAYMVEKTGDTQAAVEIYRQSLSLEPNQPVALGNLGVALADLGRIDEAMDCYRRALDLDPDSADAHNALGLALLLRGDYAAAWPHHEHRPRDWVGEFRVPRWKGEPLAGQRILLHAEQGMGDTLQFARYVPMVAARGGRVVLAAMPALARLLEGVPGVEQLVTGKQPPADIDWHCPLMSLPFAFGTTRETIPGPWPYLQAPADRIAPWRDRVGGAGRLKVGLVWQGQPKLRRDRDRSLPPAALAPLAGIAGVRYYALQKTAAGSGCADLPAALDATDLAGGFADYAETAAALMALDLVIAVDTSVAHLAGALGRPVWILISKVPDWRWGEAGDDSPWYPSVRLFRQTIAGVWDDVIAEVVRALVERVR